MLLSRVLLTAAICWPALAPAKGLREIPAEITRGEAIGLACTSCHGANGVSFGSVPSLKGRPAAELEKMLLAYRANDDRTTIMSRIAKGFSKEDITVVSDYFGSMK